MSKKVAIELKNVSKKFKLKGTGHIRTLKEIVIGLLKPGKIKELWALKDVSFFVSKGETLGIIGHNGAGKSTLLSLIAGTLKPTSGYIYKEGFMSSLLELGAGFHPDLTGRENIYLYGAIMGIKREDMRKKFDKIVEFAELKEFIDEPVKHYSSGMYVRLGFSVAIEVEPEILLIDEVLAVGDLKFQAKCVERIKNLKERGTTMLIVSHDLHTIQSICDRILLLTEGTITGIGGPADIIETYRKQSKEIKRKEWGRGDVIIVDCFTVNKENKKTEVFNSGELLCVNIVYEAKRKIEKPVFGFNIRSSSGAILFGSNTQISKFNIPYIEGKGVVKLIFKSLNLGRGDYTLSFSIHSEDHMISYHRIENAIPLHIECKSGFEGVMMETEWSHEQ